MSQPVKELVNYVVESYKSDRDRFRLVNKFEDEMRKAKVRGEIEYDEKKMLIMYSYKIPARYRN